MISCPRRLPPYGKPPSAPSVSATTMCRSSAELVLHQGKIAEMRTGEGKTLVATLPLYLNALTGKGVHLVTVNDYLARRDARWMGQIYDFLGLTVGILQMAAATENGKKAFLVRP